MKTKVEDINRNIFIILLIVSPNILFSLNLSGIIASIKSW